MALIKCFKCNEKISEHADMCPHCGCVYSKEIKNSIAYFNTAKYEYNLAVDIVRKIENISKKFNPLFSGTLALKELDYCIQELLYTIATKEGNFDSVKKYFLTNIVEYGDIFADKIVADSAYGFCPDITQLHFGVRCPTPVCGRRDDPSVCLHSRCPAHPRCFCPRPAPC